MASVILFPISAWARFTASLDVARFLLCLGRMLLLFTACELITMPVTQEFWTWDRVLHGGQDFELGLLVVITCLCLILLNAEQSKRTLGLLLAIESIFLPVWRRAGMILSAISLFPDHRPKIPSRLPALSFNAPLLI
jgi:hypothetical protein